MSIVLAIIGKVILSTLIVVVGSLPIIDPLLGRVWYTKDVSISEPLRNPTTQRVIIAAVGFQNSGDAVMKTLGPELQAVANVLWFNYPARWEKNPEKTIDALYEAFKAAMEEYGFIEPSFYGGSMGGSITAKLLLRYKAEDQPFGKVPFVLVDNAGGSPRSIKPPARVLSMGGKAFGFFGPIATTIKAPIVRWWVKDAINELGPGINRNTIISHYWAMGFAPMPQVAGELRFMHAFDITGMNLVGTVERLMFTSGPDLTGDALINNEVAIEEWRKAFPKLEVKLFESRGLGAHNTVAENPHDVAREFTLALAPAA